LISRETHHPENTIQEDHLYQLAIDTNRYKYIPQMQEEVN